MLNKESLKNRIISELETLGFTQNDFSWFDLLAQALANAVIDELVANGETTMAGSHNHGLL